MNENEKSVDFEYITTTDEFMITGEWHLIPQDDKIEKHESSQENEFNNIRFKPSSEIKIDDLNIEIKFCLCDPRESIDTPILIFVDVDVKSNDDKLIMPFTMHFELRDDNDVICCSKHQVEYNCNGKRAIIIFSKKYGETFKSGSKYTVRFNIQHTMFTPKFEPVSIDELLDVPDPGSVVMIQKK